MARLYAWSWTPILYILLFIGGAIQPLRAGPFVLPSPPNDSEYPGVPLSHLYQVTVTDGATNHPLVVFQTVCPDFQLGYQNLRPVDQYPLERFHGCTLSWANFSFSGAVTVQVRVPGRVFAADSVKILPSRFGLTPLVRGDTISFALTQPGQFSVEIGDEARHHGLMIFANPPETDQPDLTTGQYYVLKNGTPSLLNAVPAACSSLYFSSGVHDIGVYRVPAHVKNIYFAPGAWVYGAFLMDGHPAVKIFGRGVLSGARLNYREAHAVEAINHSDLVDLAGIVVADTKFFAVRLLGTNNAVNWVKVVGGWTYNTDGIAAFAGSTVAHCFIRANDDSIKPYADNLQISDCVVWQLNNGAVIQLGWGNDKASHVSIRHVDVLHAEWNNDAPNRGVISCIGDKFAKGNMISWQRDFLIEDLVTETPMPFIFNIRPNPASPDQIQNFTFKNWLVKMDFGKGWTNRLEGGSRAHPWSGLVFDNIVVNGVKLTAANWSTQGRFETKNIMPPAFR